MQDKALDEYTKDELIEIISGLKRQKKFGLVWEEKPEKVVEECQQKIPTLAEVSDKAIVAAGDTEPTNLIIEGDNYHSLSVLNYTYAGKIDVIYIDPPYNTGNRDFVYNDNYVDKEDAFRHSKWLSFMSRRLALAKDLLVDDGVIFISIDDNEYAHLKLLCDQIFGESNFVDAIVWKKTENIKMDSKFLSQNKDYILVYRKSPALQEFTKEISTTERFKLEDEKGKYYLRKLDSKSHTYTKGLDYVIEHDGVKYYAGGSKELWEQRQAGNAATYAPRWLWSKKNYEQGLADGEIVFKNGNVYNKVRYDGKAKKPFINIQTLVSQQTGQKELDGIFGKRVFDHPKPVEVVKWLIKLFPRQENIRVLDFFAGSGTTGQAVLELNRDGKNRQFILCTNNENQIAEEVTYPRIKSVVAGYGSVAGIPANVRYFRTEFVEKENSMDATRDKLLRKCVDMVRIREATFELVRLDQNAQFYKSESAFTAIIFDPFATGEIWQEIERLNTDKIAIKLYVFSYSRDVSAFTDEIPATELSWEAVAIPESILRVYKKLFGTKKENQ